MNIPPQSQANSSPTVAKTFKFLNLSLTEELEFTWEDHTVLLIFIHSVWENTYFSQVMEVEDEFKKLLGYLFRIIWKVDLRSDKVMLEAFSLALDLLTNIASRLPNCRIIVSHEELMKELAEYWFNRKNATHDLHVRSLKVLKNLSRDHVAAATIVKLFPGFLLDSLDILSTMGSVGEKNAYYEVYAAFVRNAMQTSEGQQWLKDAPIETFNIMLNILQDFDYNVHNIEIRNHMAVAIRNFCVIGDNHKWLLELPYFPRLLLSLAGPEEFTDKEYSEMHYCLRHLPADKKFEPLENIRMTVLEIILQLCRFSENRELIRQTGAYYILREFHKREPVDRLKDFTEDLVNVLIRTENEIGFNDIRNLDKDLPEEAENNEHNYE